MKKWFLILSISLVFIPSLCVLSQSSISGVINIYTKVVAISTNCKTDITVNSSTGYHVGDTVLIIQMKGADITTSNTAAFGTILNYNDAGNYEFSEISAIAGNIISLKYNLLRTYDPAKCVQLVKIPSYVDVIIAGLVSAAPWDGNVGGVLAFYATGKITMNADIDVSGSGFRGGALTPGTYSNCHGDTSNYFLPDASLASSRKGEGVYIESTTMYKGLGANANGGGGGNEINAGGAGGGNYGWGGHGGDVKTIASCPVYFYMYAGGSGGKNLNYSNSINKIFLGGGGGCGHQNDNSSTPGTNGGGIIIIKAAAIVGNGHSIVSDGINNTMINSSQIDGQGGGGAGGTVLLDVPNFSSLSVSVDGGFGGTDTYTGTDCHGKGGGGGGGIIWVSSSLSGLVTSVSGGVPGMFNDPNSACYPGSNGALAGQSGGIISGLQIPFGNVQITLPVVRINGDTSICYGDSTVLTVLGGVTYQWNTGSTNASITVLPVTETSYTVKAFNGACSVSTSVTVIVNSLPQPGFTVSPDHCSVTRFINTTIGATSYLWYFGDSTLSVEPNPSHQYINEGTYNVKLIAKSGEGCKDSVPYLPIEVKLREPSTFFVPNTFSPDGDDLNEIFKVVNTGLGEFNGKIFNRWGELIYEWNNANEGWDGTYKGRVVPSGVYIYIIKATALCGSATYERKGTITVLR